MIIGLEGLFVVCFVVVVGFFCLFFFGVVFVCLFFVLFNTKKWLKGIKRQVILIGLEGLLVGWLFNTKKIVKKE